MSADGLALNVRFLRLECRSVSFERSRQKRGKEALQGPSVAVAILATEFFECDSYFFVGDFIALKFAVS